MVQYIFFGQKSELFFLLVKIQNSVYHRRDHELKNLIVASVVRN